MNIFIINLILLLLYSFMECTKATKNIYCENVRDDIKKLAEVIPKEQEQIKEENI